MHEPTPNEPNLEELTGIAKPEQVPFDLLNEHESIQMDLDGFVVHNALRVFAGQSAEETSGLFGPDSGRLVVGDDGRYRAEGSLGTDLGVTALFAAHIVVRTGHEVVVDWGNINGAAMVMMSMKPYVDALRGDPDVMYAPEYEDFNHAALELYASMRMKMPEDMRLSSSDQLVVAHAAHNLRNDFADGNFPDEPR